MADHEQEEGITQFGSTKFVPVSEVTSIVGPSMQPDAIELAPVLSDGLSLTESAQQPGDQHDQH